MFRSRRKRHPQGPGNGNSYAIEGRKHILCQNCIIKENCFCTAQLICPISLNGKIVGTISLLSFDGEQKKELVSRQSQYFDFMTRMGELIASRAQLSEMMDNISSNERFLKTIIDSVSEGIIAVDAEGKISYVNNVVEKIFNYHREHLIGQPVTDFFPARSCRNAAQPGEGYGPGNGGQPAPRQGQAIQHRPHYHGNEIVGAVKTFKDVKRLSRVAAKILQEHEQITFDDIRGTSEAIQRLKEQARIVAAGNSTVLLRGESGTGKELFARAIHEASPYRNGPFQAINCSAIPEALLESELFGYEEGAFTGARKGGKPGKFELADGGTLFLDEIGDMPLTLQAKLLRVLESNKLERVGGNKEYSFNVRLIAATNRNPRRWWRTTSSVDLYYRLNSLSFPACATARRTSCTWPSSSWRSSDTSWGSPSSALTRR